VSGYGYSYWGWGVQTDNKGNYKYTRFVPKEPGYYKIVLEGFKWEEWHPLSSYKTFAIYVSEKDYDNDGMPDKYDYDPFDPSVISRSDVEKDSDDDGVPDQYDYDPYDPDVQSRSDLKMPGFEAVFAIMGLLIMAYLLRRRK